MLTPFDLALVSPGSRLRVDILLKAIRDLGIRKIFDCGCGAGVLARALTEKKILVWGCDHSLGLISQAQKNIQQACFFVGNLANMPFEDHSMANMVLADVIEHAPDPDVAFQEMSRVLAHGGKALLTIPNPMFERVCNLVYLSQKDIGHCKTYSRGEIEPIALRHGFTIHKHEIVCNPAAAFLDALIAKLAILKHGKEAVVHSQMAIKTSSSPIFSRGYFFFCKLIFPLIRWMEAVLPSSLGTENLIILTRP